MKIKIHASSHAAGQAASRQAAAIIHHLLASQAYLRMVVATGASQFELLNDLIHQPGLAWDRVTIFHLDEYVGLAANHPASFRRYLNERLIGQVPVGRFHPVQGDALDIQAECNRLNALIAAAPIDLALIGIGENGHIAFNDPPADFITSTPYIVVNLDEACRRQQVGEGWFTTLEGVPSQAISMSVRQIMRSQRIICTVPDLRKAQAVQCAVEGPVSSTCPASILQEHNDCTLFLDPDSASLIKVG